MSFESFSSGSSAAERGVGHVRESLKKVGKEATPDFTKKGAIGGTVDAMTGGGLELAGQSVLLTSKLATYFGKKIIGTIGSAGLEVAKVPFNVLKNAPILPMPGGSGTSLGGSIRDLGPKSLQAKMEEWSKSQSSQPASSPERAEEKGLEPRR